MFKLGGKGREGSERGKGKVKSAKVCSAFVSCWEASA